MQMIWSFCVLTVLACCSCSGSVLNMLPSLTLGLIQIKSVVMIVTAKEDQKMNFPSFYLANKILNVVSKGKYLDHIMRSNLFDVDDGKRPFCKLYMQANMLTHKFKV